ncbi:haptoglobin [Anguilla rostrata]|uniref:haptoglobin n=1 Tax=Anguilla rostrata TaxID=7938 RepID=UPI0030D17926
MQSPVVVLLLAFCVGLSYASGPQIRSRRLVGGSLTRNVPWQVLLQYSDSVLDGGIGGGALISERWILTSGRNLFLNKTGQPTKREPTDLPLVYVGTTNRRTLDPAQAVEVEKVFLHPDFQNASTWDNNLALIKLKKQVNISAKVQPIPLPGAGQDLEDKEGTRGVVSGWGWGNTFTFSELLKYLVVPVVNRGLCQAEYKQGGRVLRDTPQVDDRTFCTGATELKENVCFGDEGGALAVLDPTGDRVYAAGILSFDKSCQVEKYAVYTKVSAYLPWIISVMRGDSDKSDALRASAMHQMLGGV